MRDATSDYDLLIHPGLGNSGVDHWQSYWCLAFRNATRVLQNDWDNPKREDWLRNLDAAVAMGTRPAILVCHSLSCSLAAHWLTRRDPGRVVAAFLVAPSDVESPAHTPDTTRDFAPMPRATLPVPSLVVGSTNDEYVLVERAEDFARSWGADFCNAGEIGHINSASRLGYWPQGLLMFGQLLARLKS